ADLINGLGPPFPDTTIVATSEFGRTVKQNVNNGTDHDHGNVIWLMGGTSPGGRVYGRWSGLAANALYEQRDLPITAGFRSILRAVLSEQVGIAKKDLGEIFPNFQGKGNPFIQA